MREKGLGTPATRAQIIEGLIARALHLPRRQASSVPTAKAFSLMTLLHGLGVPELFSPELTAEWEFKLAQMEHGKLKRDEFMREIVDDDASTSSAQAKNYESDTIPGDFATLTRAVPEVRRRGARELQEIPVPVKCDFGFWKIMGGRQLEPAEAETLIARARGRPARRLPQQARPAVLGQAQAQRRQRSRVRFRPARRRRRRRGARLLRPDAARAVPEVRRPRVRDAATPTSARRRSGPDKTCDFRSGRTILQRPIERAQMEKLLAHRQDRPAAVRVGAHAPAVLRVSSCGSPTARSASSSRRRIRRARARPQRARRAGARARPHPKDKQPVELHAGRYGPYVKHGDVNATLPDKDKVDALTLDEALALLAEKSRQADRRTQARAGQAARNGAARRGAGRPRSRARSSARRGRQRAARPRARRRARRRRPPPSARPRSATRRRPPRRRRSSAPTTKRSRQARRGQEVLSRAQRAA